MRESAKSEPVVIVYDGECPFCSAYVKMLRLRRSLGAVELVNARSDHPAAREMKGRGLDLDEGMAVKVDGVVHHGDAAIHWLSLMSTPSPGLNGAMAWLLKDRRRAKLAYPVLRAGRNMTLRLLGRRRIDGTPR